MKKVITSVAKDSIAEQLGIEKGDALVEINGSKIVDIFDYRYLISDEYIEVLIEKQNGELWEIEIEKYESEDLGLSFLEPMMDSAKCCSNKCIFCFIDQLPKGMREALYFKDDDSRLSFLTGNYVTLTNISDKDLDRIIFYHFSPINVSVHTTDEALRIKMLGNKNAGKIVNRLKRLSEAGIEINCQIVLVKGVNDGQSLCMSIDGLMEIEGVKSVSVVPVGLTKYRDGLFGINPIEARDALNIVNLIKQKQETAILKKGTSFIYASDELYLSAGVPLPPYENYDGFPQLENGVGMMRLFEREFCEALEDVKGDCMPRKVSVVTGKSAGSFMESLAYKFSKKFKKTVIETVIVTNSFFGERVTVSGLLTGSDILNEIKIRNIKGKLLIPENCFKADTDIFLDDKTVDDINKSADVMAEKISCNGKAFILSILQNKT